MGCSGSKQTLQKASSARDIRQKWEQFKQLDSEDLSSRGEEPGDLSGYVVRARRHSQMIRNQKYGGPANAGVLSRSTSNHTNSRRASSVGGSVISDGSGPVKGIKTKSLSQHSNNMAAITRKHSVGSNSTLSSSNLEKIKHNSPLGVGGVDRLSSRASSQAGAGRLVSPSVDDITPLERADTRSDYGEVGSDGSHGKGRKKHKKRGKRLAQQDIDGNGENIDDVDNGKDKALKRKMPGSKSSKPVVVDSGVDASEDVSFNLSSEDSGVISSSNDPSRTRELARQQLLLSSQGISSPQMRSNKSRGRSNHVRNQILQNRGSNAPSEAVIDETCEGESEFLGDRDRSQQQEQSYFDDPIPDQEVELEIGYEDGLEVDGGAINGAEVISEHQVDFSLINPMLKLKQPPSTNDSLKKSSKKDNGNILNRRIRSSSSLHSQNSNKSQPTVMGRSQAAKRGAVDKQSSSSSSDRGKEGSCSSEEDGRNISKLENDEEIKKREAETEQEKLEKYLNRRRSNGVTASKHPSTGFGGRTKVEFISIRQPRTPIPASSGSGDDDHFVTIKPSGKTEVSKSLPFISLNRATSATLRVEHEADHVVTPVAVENQVEITEIFIQAASTDPMDATGFVDEYILDDEQTDNPISVYQIDNKNSPVTNTVSENESAIGDISCVNVGMEEDEYAARSDAEEINSLNENIDDFIRVSEITATTAMGTVMSDSSRDMDTCSMQTGDESASLYVELSSQVGSVATDAPDSVLPEFVKAEEEMNDNLVVEAKFVGTTVVKESSSLPVFEISQTNDGSIVDQVEIEEVKHHNRTNVNADDSTVLSVSMMSMSMSMDISQLSESVDVSSLQENIASQHNLKSGLNHIMILDDEDDGEQEQKEENNEYQSKEQKDVKHAPISLELNVKSEKNEEKTELVESDNEDGSVQSFDSMSRMKAKTKALNKANYNVNHSKRPTKKQIEELEDDQWNLDGADIGETGNVEEISNGEEKTQSRQEDEEDSFDVIGDYLAYLDVDESVVVEDDENNLLDLNHSSVLSRKAKAISAALRSSGDNVELPGVTLDDQSSDDSSQSSGDTTSLPTTPLENTTMLPPFPEELIQKAVVFPPVPPTAEEERSNGSTEVGTHRDDSPHQIMSGNFDGLVDLPEAVIISHSV